MRPTELYIIQGASEITISIDKVTKFGLRPPELRRLFDVLGTYYRWFIIDKKILNAEVMDKKIDIDLRK